MSWNESTFSIPNSKIIFLSIVILMCGGRSFLPSGATHFHGTINLQCIF